MADQKITALDALTTPDVDDVLPVVDDPAGTPATKKATVVSLMKTYAFSAYPAAAQTIANTTVTTLVYDTEEYDYGSCFNTANYTFTAPVAGIYHFDFTIRFITGDVVADKYIWTYLHKNGSTDIRRGYTQTSIASAAGNSVNTDVLLAANDTIVVKVYHNFGAVADTSHTGVYSWFSGHLVRAT